MRYYQSFPTAIPQYRAGFPRVTHPSATRLKRFPSENFNCNNLVRLACVKHAASVHPEPGSNSRKKFDQVQEHLLTFLILVLTVLKVSSFEKNF